MQAAQSVVVQHREQIRRDIYNGLKRHSTGKEPADCIARMLASQVVGIGDMPRWLGLLRSEFNILMWHLFPGADIAQFDHYGNPLDKQRSDEHNELRTLFLSHGIAEPQMNEWVADILIAGCMGGDHLWQDLGLWSRKDLTALIRSAFAPLAEKNVYDMKWKKFFYKQLCIQEGVYTCRAPSCQVCADYQSCFGPE